MFGKGSGKGPKVPLSSKRNKWAEEEADSLGVAAVKDKMTQVEGWSQRWGAFILLHETLEEYGTHLVEAAWSHQVPSRLNFCFSSVNSPASFPFFSSCIVLWFSELLANDGMSVCRQMSLLLQFTKSKGDDKDAAPYWAGAWSQKKSSSVDVNFTWISVLWQRGFDHANPQGNTYVDYPFGYFPRLVFTSRL